jgi:hypothetical protein
MVNKNPIQNQNGIKEGIWMQYWSLTSTQGRLNMYHMICQGFLFVVNVLPVPSDVWVASCDDMALTHTLVPTAATSCESPFAIRKASFLRRSMGWHFYVVVFCSEITFNSKFAKFVIRGRTLDVTLSWKFSEILPVMHFRDILAAFQLLTQSGYIANSLVQLGFLLGQGARNRHLPP